MGVFDPYFSVVNIRFERASSEFGELRRLPNVTFREMDCRLLAEQYRQVRELEMRGSVSSRGVGETTGVLSDAASLLRRVMVTRGPIVCRITER